MSHRKFRLELPAMTPGTARHVLVHRFGKRGARPKVYLQAAIHADELPGVMALHHLLPMLVEADRLGRIVGEIVVVPTVNPIGLAQLVGNSHYGRYHLLGRDNFNRNWPDLSAAVSAKVGKRLGVDAAANVALVRRAALQALAEIEPMNELQSLRVQVMQLCADADVVLDLHCDAHAALHLFISRRDWPGAAEALAADVGAEAILAAEPYPTALVFSYVNSALWPRLAELHPDAALPQACFAATIEYRGQHDVNHKLGAADAANLWRFLQRRGVIDGRAGKLPAAKAQAVPMAGMDVGYCSGSGMLVYNIERGAKVRKGQVVCEIIDPGDERGAAARTPLRAGTDGVLFSRVLDGTLAWPGKVAFRIAGAKPLQHRLGLSGLDD